MRTNLKHYGTNTTKVVDNSDRVIIETNDYILFRQNQSYYLQRKKDKKQIVILKDDVETYLMWGRAEFIKECKQTNF